MRLFTVSASSRMRVMNHNWSATKQCLHLQSVAEIIRHPARSARGQDSTVWDTVRASSQGHKPVSTGRHFPRRHRSVLAPCEIGLAETTAAEGGVKSMHAICLSD